jgi:hypothetical protein
MEHPEEKDPMPYSIDDADMASPRPYTDFEKLQEFTTQ